MIEIKAPKQLTVGTLRKYLDDWEATWTDKDEEIMGKFEDHKINCFYPSGGIGLATITYDAGLDFVIMDRRYD